MAKNVGLKLTREVSFDVDWLAFAEKMFKAVTEGGAGARAAGRGSVLPPWPNKVVGRVGVRLSGLMRQPDASMRQGDAYLRHSCVTIGHQAGEGVGDSTSGRRRSSRDQVATGSRGMSDSKTRRHFIAGYRNEINLLTRALRNPSAHLSAHS
jgi:hypothetical protein